MTVVACRPIESHSLSPHTSFTVAAAIVSRLLEFIPALSLRASPIRRRPRAVRRARPCADPVEPRGEVRPEISRQAHPHQKKKQHHRSSPNPPCVSEATGPDVRFGSKANVELRSRDVRFTPNSGHQAFMSTRPKPRSRALPLCGQPSVPSAAQAFAPDPIIGLLVALVIGVGIGALAILLSAI
jgi:hypothetical protein